MILTPVTAVPTPEVDFSGKTFLIVDDFQGMRTVIRDVLRNCGANSKLVETAADGKDAIRLLGAQPFDVVLCDFNLGPGPNGQQVLEEAKAGLAKVLVQNGELEPAKSLLQETIHDSPYYLEAHDLLAHTFQALGELDAAAQSLEHATKLSPNSVARQKTLGDVSLKLGRLDHAERAFRKSVTLGQHSVLKAPDAFFGLAKTCSAKDNPMEALKVLGELNKTFTDDQTRLKSMAIEGIVHHKTGNFKKAVELAAAVEREVAAGGAPVADQSSLDVARLLFATGKQERAVEFLQNQVRNNPDNAALLDEVKEIFSNAAMAEEGAALVETSRQEGIEFMNRGVLLARDGSYEEAIASLREARQAMPANVRVLFNLAYVLITRMQKAGRAPELLSEAREALLAANSRQPGLARYVQLRATLDALAHGGKTEPVL